ncbi:MAG: hypothetical protein FWF49_06510 [Oscillospiraceae bacterium]|nr:hypothetical protein [Oscillospiraceae bacterium]
MRKASKRIAALVFGALLTVCLGLTAWAATPVVGDATKAADWTAGDWAPGSVTIKDGTGGAGASVTFSAGKKEYASYNNMVSKDFTLQATLTFDPTYQWPDGESEHGVYFYLNDPTGIKMMWVLHTSPGGQAGGQVQVWDPGKNNWTDVSYTNWDDQPDGGFPDGVSLTLVAAHQAGTDVMMLAMFRPGDDAPFQTLSANFARTALTTAVFDSPNGLQWGLQNNGDNGTKSAFACTYSDIRAINEYTDLTPTTTAWNPSLVSSQPSDSGATTTAATTKTDDGTVTNPSGMPLWGWIAIGVAAVVIIGGSITFFVLKGRKKAAK